MRHRCAHALIACALFFGIAHLYGWVAQADIDQMRVLVWSTVGVTIYTALSFIFGFDPYRRTDADDLPPLLRYIDQWELRSGQSTLSLLGILMVAAWWIDAQYFVTAVVSGTLAAYMYFTTRLCLGAYARG
jgi:hypothetical protein